jgi:hypothetical protein
MTLVDQSASLVRRTRAGDQNAEATIYEVGEHARRGVPLAQQAFSFIMSYIQANPNPGYRLADGPPMVMKTSGKGTMPVQRGGSMLTARMAGEMRKPQLARGALQGLRSPEDMAGCILDACQCRNGLQAAAVVLARGPLLTNPVVGKLGEYNFGHEKSRRAFFHGVQFSGEQEFREVAPALEPNLRRCLAIGQCVGRARALQAVRMPGSRIGAYNEVAGWEMGE